jgi:sulfur-carrier protein
VIKTFIHSLAGRAFLAIPICLAIEMAFGGARHAAGGWMRRLSEKRAVLAAMMCAGYNSCEAVMTVKVLFFGRLKELVGVTEDAYDSPRGAAIEEIFAHYAERHPKLAAFRPSVVASRNREFASWDTLVHAGDEVAFLPPVSGGD